MVKALEGISPDVPERGWQESEPIQIDELHSLLEAFGHPGQVVFNFAVRQAQSEGLVVADHTYGKGGNEPNDVFAKRVGLNLGRDYPANFQLQNSTLMIDLVYPTKAERSNPESYPDQLMIKRSKGTGYPDLRESKYIFERGGRPTREFRAIRGIRNAAILRQLL